MNTKTMEGLVGARTSINLLNTPMRIFEEARRKGDTATMERAMGYADEISDKAQDYKAEADKGMKEDAKEAREKAKVQREEASRKRREEREKLEKEVLENKNVDADTVTKETNGCLFEISEEGKVLLEDSKGMDSMFSAETRTNAVKGAATAEKTDSIKGSVPDTMTAVVKEPVTYTKAGVAVSGEQSISISVSI